MQTPIDFDSYRNSFPDEVQLLLNQLRKAIKEIAPNATEIINYGIPTFKLHGNLVHFAAYKKHIGFYPAPSGIEAFKQELSLYKGAKGSVQFPIDQPLPLDLIKKIVAFRVTENTEKAMIRTCKNGHQYYKSSDCPVCPICEAERKPTEGFLSELSAPARRALENNGILTLNDLSGFTEKEILAFHGMGKSSIPKLKEALLKEGLHLKT